MSELPSKDQWTPSPAKDRTIRFFFLLSLVAGLLVFGWLLLKAREPNAGELAASPSLLQDVRISSSSEPGVAASFPARFRAGEKIYVHFALQKRCSLFVGALGLSLAPSSLSSAAIERPAGPQTLGPFDVEAGTGREAMIVLASEKPRTTADFERFLGRAGDAVRGVDSELGAKLAGILAALRAHEGLSAEAVQLDRAR